MSMCSRGTPPMWLSYLSFSPSTKDNLSDSLLRREAFGSESSEMSDDLIRSTRSRMSTQECHIIQKLWNCSSELRQRPRETLIKMADVTDLNVHSREFAEMMDNNDLLGPFRQHFTFPLNRDVPGVDLDIVEPSGEAIYLCGQSLGLKPKMADQFMRDELNEWGKWGVNMHVKGKWPAALCDHPAKPSLARIVGGQMSEIAVMNSLTTNLHLLLMTFYKPQGNRCKILYEENVFPSDRFVLQSQVSLRGLNAQETLIPLRPRAGENTLRNEDIKKVINEKGNDIALVYLNGVDYRTGQLLDMEGITHCAKANGCMIGWDLAHAAGNVPMQLHKWNVDFACWCSYKYLNAGAGGVGAVFVHQKHHNSEEWKPKFLGWWSQRDDVRFEFGTELNLAEGADAFRLSNPSPWHNALLMASMKIYDQTNMEELRTKQRLLTGYLELLIRAVFPEEYDHRRSIQIITPEDPEQRGNQLTLKFRTDLRIVKTELSKRGVVCDVRPPYLLRVAPAPLYNSFEDVHRFVATLEEAMDTALA